MTKVFLRVYFRDDSWIGPGKVQLLEAIHESSRKYTRRNTFVMTKVFLRVYFRDDSWIGPGKVQLLEAIQEHGSISAAARVMDMSYRRAWLLIDGLNALFDTPAVSTTLGGRGGGTAALTPFGLEIVKRYRAMHAAAEHAIARDAAALARHVRAARRR